MIRASVQAHWKDLLATLVALSIGMGISTAALLVFASARPQVPTALAATAAVVRAPAAGHDAEQYTEYLPWSPAEVDAVTDELRRAPGIASAVPVRTFYAQLVLHGEPVGTPDADDPEGRAWSAASLAPYDLSAGRPPVGAADVAVSDAYGVRVGEQVPVLTTAGQRVMTVTATVGGPGIYFSDAQAQEIGSAVTLIGMMAQPGVDAEEVVQSLRPLLPVGASLLVGDERSAAEAEGIVRTRYLGTQLLTLMLGLTLFAVVFVVSQTFALAAVHRRRDTALLRALGATPGRVRRMLLSEAAAVALLGSVLGIGLGLWVAPQLGEALVAAGLEPTGFVVRSNPLVVLALPLGPLVAVVATWSAARRAAQVAPLEAIRAAAPSTRRLGRWRLLAGAAAALGTLGTAFAAASAQPEQIAPLAATATVLAVTAITWLGPLVLPPAIRVLTWPLTRGRGATGVLVRGAMTTAAARTTSTTAPVLLTVALATLVFGYVDTERGAYGGQDVPAGATTVIAAAGAPGLAEDTVTQTRELVDGPLDATLRTQVFTGAQPRATPAIGSLDVPDGTAVPSRELAERNGWEPGQDVAVTAPDGTQVVLRVSVVDAQRPGSVIMLPRALVREHDAVALTPRIILTEVTPAELQSLLRPGVRVQSPAQYARTGDAEEYRLLRTFALVAMGLALGYTLLAVINTLLMATAARGPDLRTLRLSGAIPRQVAVSLFAESFITVLADSLLGLLAGLIGVLGVRRGLAAEAGREVALAVPWGWIGALVLVCAVLAGIAGTWPSRATIRRSPTNAL